jgi:hypothetical protein
MEPLRLDVPWGDTPEMPFPPVSPLEVSPLEAPYFGSPWEPLEAPYSRKPLFLSMRIDRFRLDFIAQNRSSCLSLLFFG